MKSLAIYMCSDCDKMIARSPWEGKMVMKTIPSSEVCWSLHANTRPRTIGTTYSEFWLPLILPGHIPFVWETSRSEAFKWIIPKNAIYLDKMLFAYNFKKR